MDEIRLGRTGLSVTVVGFGGAPIGRATTEEADALAAVWAALEGGITLIDTSPHYGLGLSESRIGEALRRRPNLARDCTGGLLAGAGRMAGHGRCAAGAVMQGRCASQRGDDATPHRHRSSTRARQSD